MHFKCQCYATMVYGYMLVLCSYQNYVTLLLYFRYNCSVLLLCASLASVQGVEYHSPTMRTVLVHGDRSGIKIKIRRHLSYASVILPLRLKCYIFILTCLYYAILMLLKIIILQRFTFNSQVAV